MLTVRPARQDAVYLRRMTTIALVMHLPPFKSLVFDCIDPPPTFQCIDPTFKFVAPPLCGSTVMDATGYYDISAA